MVETERHLRAEIDEQPTLGPFVLALHIDNEIAHRARAFLMMCLQQQISAVVEVHVDPVEILGICIGLFVFVIRTIL